MEARLGDDVDDFCVKCKRLTNHVVVSLLNDGPAKVRCRTCHGDHDYRHEQAPPPKIDPRKAALLLKAQEASASAPSPVVAVDGTVDGVLDASVAIGAASTAEAARSPVKAKKAGRAQAHSNG